ncbi:MAG: TonB-dependent receptor [candidate division NC10 bacterium]|nr:TonB-dependent receptor [candidate division NC10 bacterium]
MSHANRHTVWVRLLLLSLIACWPTHVGIAAERPTESTTPAQPQGQAVELEPVVVTATRTEMKLKEVPASVTVLTKEDIAQSGALAVDDLLRQIPGFNTFRRSSSLFTAPQQDPEAQGVTLRGVGPGGASRALVLLDGIPVNDAFGGFLYWGELPLENIERIEVVRGGGSNLWGSFALGGVINIITKTPEKRTVETKLSAGNLGTTDDTLSYTDVVGPLRVGLYGNFLHTDGYNIIAPNQRGPIDQDSGSEHKTFNGRLEYSPASNLSLFLRGAYYTEDRNLGTPLRVSDTDRGFIAGGGTLRTADGSEWQLTMFSHLTTFNEQFSRINDPRTSESVKQIQQVPSTDVGGAFTWTRRFFTDHLLTAGTDFRLIDGETRDTFVDPSGAISEVRVSKGEQNFFGFFIQDVYTPIPRLQIALGVRIDHFEIFNGSVASTATVPAVTPIPDQDRTVTSPKLAFRYQLLDGLALRGAGYQAFRAPTLSELTRESSVEGLKLLPNRRLGPEFLEGGELGFDFWGLPGLNARITAYWNNLRSAIVPVGDEDERTPQNIGSARIRGIEADLEYRLTRQWTLTGSYLYSEALIMDSPQDRDLEGKRLTQVPWHSATVGVRYTNPALVNVLVQWRYEGKKFEDADNMDKLAGYYVVDLTLSKPIPPLAFLPTFKGGQIFLAIQNLFDRQYDTDKGGGILKIGTPFSIQGGARLEF